MVMGRMKFIILLAVICAGFFPENLIAQTTYTGKVTGEDLNEALIGVNLFILGSNTGALTDFDGKFSIEASPGDSLQISYIGYETIVRVLGDQTELNVVMFGSASLLEEVVVVGYGSQRSRDLTSSITTVRSEEIVKTPSSAAMQSLQGKVAGLQIVSSGAPGDEPTVRLRGIGSYTSDDTKPLYVVDGMFFDNIDFLNSSDIASISVLKDASAAAIYGVRAANGVVLIQTKSGELNKPAEISIDSYVGTQHASNVLKMANAEQFAQVISELDPDRYPDYQFIENAMQKYGRSRVNPNVPNVNTDWYKEILRPASIQNHNIGVSGGGSRASYSLGGSYFVQDGIMDMENDFTRFNVRSKLDFQALDWLKIGGNVIMSSATKQSAENGAWFKAYFAVPILPVFDNNIDGELRYASAQDLGYRGGQNPFVDMRYSNNEQKIRKILGNFYAEVDIIPDALTFKSTYNQSMTFLNLRNIRLPYFSSTGYQRNISNISRNFENFNNIIWDNTLTYDEDFGKHSLTVLGGTSYREETFENLRAQAEGFPIENEQSWYIDKSTEILTNSVSDGGAKLYGMSYFGRVAYSYNNKYLAYATYRADGSSKYQEKWGYFPAAGLGWVVSEESFFDLPFVDFFKLRGGWGRLGNDKIGASLGTRSNNVVTTALGDVQYTGLQTGLGFDYLIWELVEESNFGITAEAFNQRLNLDLDVFQRDTKNSAIPINNPGIGGSNRRSAGVIRNSGVELALGWNDAVGADWSYSLGGNISFVKNTVEDLFGQTYIDGGTAEFRQRTEVGHSLFEFYGYEVLGVYQNQAEINADGIETGSTVLEPGDLRFKDQDGDGDIDGDDRIYLGSFLPSMTYGFNLGLNYKNISLSIYGLGQSGNKILNRKRGEYRFTNDTNLDADLAINRWHGEGTSNKYPSANGLRKSWNQDFSSYYIEDGSYFRIQNINLSYRLSTQKWLGENFPQATLYLTADRPITIFKYNGFDPEVANGIDRQTYPIPSVYTGGIKLKF